MIATGSPAPDFALYDQRGALHRLSDYRGRYVLIVFYPGDNTIVCTRQLCNYRDNWEGFARRNIALLGINPESAQSHREFAEKYGFPFPLLVDTGSAVARQYGAVGRMGMTRRAYTLLSPAGTVLYSMSELTTLTHRSAHKLLSVFDSLHTEPAS